MLSCKKGQGFTIIELLVAVGVTAILVALMLSITINVLNGWNRSSGRLSNENQARLILDQLSQDIQGAIMRRDLNTWLAATVQRDQSGTGDSAMSGTLFTGAWSGTVKPDSSDDSLRIDPVGRQIKDYRFGQAGVWLRFFTTPPDNATNNLVDSSAPRAVSYQMIRVQVGTSDQYTYGLFRSEVRPFNPAGINSTFGIGYDLFMNQTDVPSYNNRSDTNPDDPDHDGNAGNIRRPTAFRVLATNVIDFGVKLYGRSGTAEVELFPVRRDAVGDPTSGIPSVPFTFAVSSRNAADPVSITGIGSIDYGFPTAAEVMVRILTPEGVRLISALESGNLPRPPEASDAAAHWWLIALQHSDVFTRRVEFRAKSL